MIDYQQRGAGEEYMDTAGAAGADLLRALAELRYVNRFLGGTRATLKALEQVVEGNFGQIVEVLDLGTGAGDIPEAMVEWGRARGVDIRLRGETRMAMSSSL